MSVVEGTRKVVRDFLAPELGELKTRVEALEHKIDDNKRRADRRHDEVMVAIPQVPNYAVVLLMAILSVASCLAQTGAVTFYTSGIRQEALPPVSFQAVSSRSRAGSSTVRIGWSMSARAAL